MTNTGYKQAAVVYKVRASDGAPVDLDGVPISESGRKQAIAVLAGHNNPNPALYDVEFTFVAEASIDGEPTVELSDDCATGYIFISPAPGATTALTLANPTATFAVVSSAPWVATVPAGVAVAPGSGPRDSTVFVLSRNGNGQGKVIFTNTISGQTVSMYVISVDVSTWILATHAWDMNGIWDNTAIWGV